MAAPRLPFLYSNFLRAVRSCEPTTRGSLRVSSVPAAKLPPKANLHTSARRDQDTIPQRYGPAASHNLPPPPKPSEQSRALQEPAEKQNEESKHASQKSSRRRGPTAENVGQDEPVESNATYVDETSMTEKRHDIDVENKEPLDNKELDLILSIPSPSELKEGDAPRHPHLEPSPYEHHFDTYSLVRQLADKTAYDVAQATTLMKAVRLMLALNLDVAKEGLVSKSDIENESYLFRAACSEMKTTLQTTRHSEILQQRSQRAQLQHEYDILNQKVTQDLMTLKEELKGLFNDRKLALQQDKRKIDGKISELNYEITVLLNSEARSEVEGLRWVLTRRAAMAIGLCALMIITSLNYSSIKLREKEEKEKKRKAAQKEQDEREQAMQREQARYTTPSRAQGTQTDVGVTTEFSG
ncbi:hypothetical protein H2200_012129 [Cladophialophora chaetospira]|uniref:MOZ protein represents a chromatin-associated acetyltransferase n=1 Tax=Cladophialophora chaetospira TaxID=386627 RepID=A0AA39CCN0_9EURO|nr:hypothetical protein H2200_012129 [Cladophialophora chaetospira]